MNETQMNKDGICRRLTAMGIPYELTEHKAVFNMEELNAMELPYPEWDAKNLFVRDDKKRNYYLITVQDRFQNTENHRTALKQYIFSQRRHCHEFPASHSKNLPGLSGPDQSSKNPLHALAHARKAPCIAGRFPDSFIIPHTLFRFGGGVMKGSLKYG